MRSTLRLVLVRHGEAECNLNGVVGGMVGCTGLTKRGVAQAEALRDRLARTGELFPTVSLYSSPLPRAVQTAEIIAPALGRWAGTGERPLPWVRDPDLCELRPGDADGLTWEQFSERFAEPDWDRDPDQPIAPNGESWTGFVSRAATALRAIANRVSSDTAASAAGGTSDVAAAGGTSDVAAAGGTSDVAAAGGTSDVAAAGGTSDVAAAGGTSDVAAAGGTSDVAAAAAAADDPVVVVVCHAGVIEASLLRMLPVDPAIRRLRLRTAHTSLTEWRVQPEDWLLERYNDDAHWRLAQET